jgi:hypothetical protein
MLLEQIEHGDEQLVVDQRRMSAPNRWELAQPMPELALHPGDIGLISPELLRGARSPDKFSQEPRRIGTRGGSPAMREASISISAVSSGTSPLQRMPVTSPWPRRSLSMLTTNA